MLARPPAHVNGSPETGGRGTPAEPVRQNGAAGATADNGSAIMRKGCCSLIAALLAAVAASAAGPAAQGPSATDEARAADEAKRIAQLVADLEAKDLKTIMAAHNALMEIGTPALKPLHALLRSTTSPTTRIRVSMMGKEIIKRSKEPPEPADVDDKRFGWSEPVNGIAIRLSIDRDRYQPGQVVRLRVDFRNVDAEERPLAPLTRINLPNSSGSKIEGRLAPAGPNDAARPVQPREYQKHPLEMPLKPGQIVTWRFRLNEKLEGQYKVMLMHDQLNNQNAGLPLPAVSTVDMPLPAGETEIRFTYYAASRGLLKGATTDLTATVRVRVEEPPATGD